MSELGRIAHGIDARCCPDDSDIAAIAARQHGVVAYRQLLDLGFGRGAVQHRVEAGRLHRVHVGVYAVGHLSLSVLSRWMAAVLACGLNALLSHRSAAALLDLSPTGRSVIDVTAGRGSRNRPGVVVHRVRHIQSIGQSVKDGIPTTNASQTILDLARSLPARHLERVVEQAERLQLLDVDESSASRVAVGDAVDGETCAAFCLTTAPFWSFGQSSNAGSSTSVRVPACRRPQPT